jgi:ubiquinone/menaquinone biosynthesis C-methylase UbiE
MVVANIETGSVLDVGCGTGKLLSFIPPHASRYGIDTSSGMLIQTQMRLPDAILSLASFYQLPYPDGIFDYVLETNTVSCLAFDVKAILREMLRVCRIGGEVRMGDYASPPIETRKHRLLIQLGALIGDYPYNYPDIFQDLSYLAQVEVMGSLDMYHYIRVVKDH